MSLEERLLGEKSRLFAVVRALKVDGLSLLDQAAVNVVRQRIKELPTPEEIKDREIDKPFCKKVAWQVGDILHLMELYGKRDMEMRQRYVARTHLLPRYKVLKKANVQVKKTSQPNCSKKEQGSNMKLEKSAAIREMVKVSSVLDEQGQAELSEKMLGCAKCAVDGTLTKEELDSTVKALEAAGYSKIVKEAGLTDMWNQFKGQAAGAWQGAKNIGHQIADPAKTQGAFSRALSFLGGVDKNIDGLKESLTAAERFVYNQGMKQAIGKLLKTVDGFKQNAAAVAKELQGIQYNLQQTTVPTGGQADMQQNQQIAPQTTEQKPQETYEQMTARHAQEKASHPQQPKLRQQNLPGM